MQVVQRSRGVAQHADPCGGGERRIGGSEEDLLKALERGKIEVAVLDVFNEEPLPVDNPLWDHPRVFITPHTASVTTPESAIISVADAIEELRKGLPFSNLVSLELGY